MKTPLFTGMLLAAVLQTVSQPDRSAADIALLVLFILLLFIPFLFRNSILPVIDAFSVRHHPLGRTLLSVHGLFFLVVLQPFGLLWTANLMMPHGMSVTHTVALLGITVMSGAFAVLASPQTVRTVARWSAALVSGTIIIYSANAFFFHLPLLPHQDRLLDIPASAGIGMKSVMVLASAVLLFWLMWMENSASAERSRRGRFAEIATAAAVAVTGIVTFMLTGGTPGGTVQPVVQTAGSLMSFGMVAGAAGLFAGTVASAGHVMAEQLYPQFDRMAAAEKRHLIAKLAVVFSVIGSILLIPVVRMFSTALPVQYIAVLAAFAAPVVTAFILFTIVRKQQPFLLAVSMMLGGLSMLPEFIAAMLAGGSDGAGLFGLSVRGAVITSVTYAVFGLLKDFVVFQRLLSLLRQS